MVETVRIWLIHSVWSTAPVARQLDRPFSSIRPTVFSHRRRPLNADARSITFTLPAPTSATALLTEALIVLRALLFAQLASQVAALPANYLAFNSVNPTSADAMRAIDAQLELRITGEKHIDYGESLEDVMRLVLRFKNGAWDPKADSLETVWANPGIMTVAQQADATTKLVATIDGQGRSVVPVEQAREDLGYGPIARARMAQMDVASVEAHQLELVAAQQKADAAKAAAVPADAPPMPAGDPAMPPMMQK